MNAIDFVLLFIGSFLLASIIVVILEMLKDTL